MSPFEARVGVDRGDEVVVLLVNRRQITGRVVGWCINANGSIESVSVGSWHIPWPSVAAIGKAES